MNTKLFHRYVVQHQARNRVLKIKYRKGVSVTKYEQMKNKAIKYYEEVFKDEAEFIENHKQVLQNVITRTISKTQQRMLLNLVMDEELKAANKYLKKRTSTGPDGFTIEFFMLN